MTRGSSQLPWVRRGISRNGKRMYESLTTDETSELTRVPAATLRWLRGRDEGPKSWKLGRRVFYRRTDVEAWLDSAYATAVGGK